MKSFLFDDLIIFKEWPLSQLFFQVLFWFLNVMTVELLGLPRFLLLSFTLELISFKLSQAVIFAVRSIAFVTEYFSYFQQFLLLFTQLLLLFFKLFFNFLTVMIKFPEVSFIFFQRFLFIYLFFYWVILPLHFRNLSTEFNLQFIFIWLQVLIPSWKCPSAALKLLTEIRVLLFVQTEPIQMLLLASL